MKHGTWYVLGFVVIVTICVSAFILAPGAEFAGADDAGSNQIQEIDPDFEPWFSSLWVPPAETQSLLFAVQAAIGAIIIGFFIGNERGKRIALEKIEKMNAVQTKAIKGEKQEKKTEDL